MSTCSLADKQAYLRSQILEGGIDATEFMEFMGKAKNQGQNIDLDSWSIQELEKVVSEYKERERAAKQLGQELKKDTRQIRKSKIFEAVLKKQKVFYQANAWDYEANYTQECNKTVKCLEWEGDRMLVTVDKYEVKTVGGFIFGIGAKRELELNLGSNILPNTKVLRKCEDFDWLRQNIIRAHPGAFVPPLEIYRQIDPEDKEELNRKIKEVERFINNLLAYQVFHSSQLLRVFLCEPNYKTFSDYKNRETVHIGDRSMGAITTVDGLLKVQITEQMQRFIKSISGVAQDMSNIYNELVSQVYRILTDLETLSTHISQIKDSCVRLEQKYTNLQDLLPKNPASEMKLPSMLSYLSSLLKSNGKSIRRQLKIFKDFAKTFTDNSSQDWQEFIQLDRRRQAEESSYLDFKQALLRKKEKCYPDQAKWEISEQEMYRLNRKAPLSKEQAFPLMFANENLTENELRVCLAYTNQNYKKSMACFLKEQENSLHGHLLKFTADYLQENEQLSAVFKQYAEMMLP